MKKKVRTLYTHQDISWLHFNCRVLAQCEDLRHPLLERLNFLSISGLNLDEFFMVRIGGLLSSAPDILFKEASLFKQIYNQTSHLLKKQALLTESLLDELKLEGVQVLDRENVSPSKYLKKYFFQRIFPLLTPIVLDSSHPFPFIPGESINIAFHLHNKERGDHKAIITLPQTLLRFIPTEEGGREFIKIEDLVMTFIEDVFPKSRVLSHGLFRLLRSAEFTDDLKDHFHRGPKEAHASDEGPHEDRQEDRQEERQEDRSFVPQFESLLKQRRLGRAVFLVLEKNLDTHLQSALLSFIEVPPQLVFCQNMTVNVGDFRELCKVPLPHLKFAPLASLPCFQECAVVSEKRSVKNIFDTLENEDILVHHPYESFDVILNFLNAAVNDPNVLSIKQTLYRTGQNSPVVDALLRAAERGKDVTVVIELKARFDEETNIKWAKSLEEKGVQVLYGVSGLKTHAKMTVVVRQEGDVLKRYVHFSTGNYNHLTARLYSDISFFSSDPALVEDGTHLFNMLTGYTPHHGLRKVETSPGHIREKLIQLIDREIQHCREGRAGYIFAKMNALVDKPIIDKLYEASQEGVQIRLVVRGPCCLRPQIPNLSENIRVKSIVGRFLEHARVFYFGNGRSLEADDFLEGDVFISSADWMPRNFDKRFEVMIPIESLKVKKKLLINVVFANLNDTLNSWTLKEDGSYQKNMSQKEFDVHIFSLGLTSKKELVLREMF